MGALCTINLITDSNVTLKDFTESILINRNQSEIYLVISDVKGAKRCNKSMKLKMGCLTVGMPRDNERQKGETIEKKDGDPRVGSSILG